ncbi:MAG: SDR family oxidoreductase [Rhodospirillales bacterium]|nr:SDR family oxidoreductase [Rhodospirillales bacterium]
MRPFSYGVTAGHAHLAVDLTAEGAAAACVAELVAAGGPFEIVINNLGGTLGVRDLDSAAADWARVWHLNVGVAIDVNNAVLPAMRRAGWGRLVHISSPAALDLRGSAPFAAVKAYLNAHVTALGRDLAETGIVASAVMPGAVSAFGNVWDIRSREAPEIVRNVLEARQPIGRLGTCDDITPFVLLLASARADFAAGCVLPVHGGWN